MCLFNDFLVCVHVCPFFSTVSHSVWIRKLRDSIVTEGQREREMVTQTANGRDRARIRSRRNKELYYFARSLFLWKKKAPSVLMSLSFPVLKLTWVVHVNRASLHSNGSIILE